MNKLIFIAVFIVVVFATAYTITDLTVKYVMADFKVTETGYTSLEVKDNFGTQTDNHYKLQPAGTPQVQ